MGWCPLVLPDTAVPGGRRKHRGWESRLGPGCRLAAQDRDRTGTHMAWSLLVATGTAWTEWPFHGAVGGKPIGWDPPSPSLPGVGPLLPCSFCCLLRAGKYRHVALGNSSQVPATSDSRGTPPAKLLLRVIFARRLHSSLLCQNSPVTWLSFPLLGSAAAFPPQSPLLPERTREPSDRDPPAGREHLWTRH